MCEVKNTQSQINVDIYLGGREWGFHVFSHVTGTTYVLLCKYGFKCIIALHYKDIAWIIYPRPVSFIRNSMVISVYAEIPSSSSLSLVFLFPSPPFLVLSWAVLSGYSLLCAWQSSVVRYEIQVSCKQSL